MSKSLKKSTSEEGSFIYKFNKKFFEPSPEYRKLIILNELSKGARSQSELSAQAGIVPSLVNKYLKELHSEGLLFKENGKYFLTEKGQLKLNYLRLEYIGEIIEFYSDIDSIFKGIEKEFSGVESVCIYGAGVVGGKVAKLLSTKGIHITCFVDDNLEKIGKKYLGAPVVSLEEIPKNVLLVIASFKSAEKMLKKAQERKLRSIYVTIFENEILRILKRG